MEITGADVVGSYNGTPFREAKKPLNTAFEVVDLLRSTQRESTGL